MTQDLAFVFSDRSHARLHENQGCIAFHDIRAAIRFVDRIFNAADMIKIAAGLTLRRPSWIKHDITLLDAGKLVSFAQPSHSQSHCIPLGLLATISCSHS